MLTKTLTASCWPEQCHGRTTERPPLRHWRYTPMTPLHSWRPPLERWNRPIAASPLRTGPTEGALTPQRLRCARRRCTSRRRTRPLRPVAASLMTLRRWRHRCVTIAIGFPQIRWFCTSGKWIGRCRRRPGRWTTVPTRIMFPRSAYYSPTLIGIISVFFYQFFF